MIRWLEDDRDCFGCEACASACVAGAIVMKADAEGFMYPRIDEDACTGCNSCAAVCPAANETPGVEGAPYAVRCNDMEDLRKSSSGGAFTLMANQVLDAGGLVCGAVFDEAFVVRHVASGDISQMRKSKYVQSRMDGVYDAIRAALVEGRQVLFTGTPCQCDGVRLMFGDADGLYLAALICRGVASPGLWADYVHFLEDLKGGALEAYCFRDKKVLDDAHTVSFTIGGKEFAGPMGADPFCRIYTKCLDLRPSCYRCKYAAWDLPFDVTFGDFWGVEKANPELADGRGTSLVIARTEKGRRLLDGMREDAIVVEAAKDAAMQPALESPAPETMLRRFLFKDFAAKGEDGRCDMALILKKFGA